MLFLELDGMIIVECFEPVTNRPTGQLVLDALSDSVIYYKGDRFGRPYLSPDSRKLVTVSHGADGTTLLLLYVRGKKIFMKLRVNYSDDILAQRQVLVHIFLTLPQKTVWSSLSM